MKFICPDPESITDSYTFEVCVKNKGKDKFTRDVKQLVEDGRKGVSHYVGPFKVTIFGQPKPAVDADKSAISAPDLDIQKINPLSDRVGKLDES